jgi:transcriptional regulator with XRE-family HTH domain
MDIKKIFGKNLKKFRKLRGLTQEKLAEKVSLSIPYIGAIEIGQKFPSHDKINKIITALNISPYLLFLEDNQSDKISKELISTKINKFIDEIINDLIPRA